MTQMKSRTRQVLAGTALVAVTLSAAACTPSAASGPSQSGTTKASQSVVKPTAPAAATATTSALPAGVLQSITDVNNGPLYPTDAFGSVWITSHRGQALDRIDPRNGRVTHIDLGQNSCSPVYPTPTLLLISACDDGTNSMVVNPRTNQVVGSIPGWVSDYAFGSGWFTDTTDTTLQRVDMATRKQIQIAKILVGAVVHGGGRLWVAEYSGLDGTWGGGIAEVDPTTNRVVRTIAVQYPGTYPSLAYAFGALWLQGAGQPLFYRIDPATEHVTTFTIPNYEPNTDLEGGSLVTGMGSVWMQTAPAVIGRFNPRTGALIAQYPADPVGGGSWPLPAYGSLWVSNFDSDQIWRDRIAP